jgi:putative hydrolase of the HAD superfamily
MQKLPMPARTYRHIFFDLDHTLWDFDSNAKSALNDLFLSFNLRERVTSDFEDFYNYYLHHNKILWNRFQKGFITAEELKWKRMWRTLLEYKIGDEKLARSLSASFMEVLPTKTAVFPHTMEILTYLQVKSYVLHLITNGFEQTQWKKIRNSGIDKYFTEVITSEASNSMKPEPQIFAFALQRSGAKLDESIMIGDNLEADIQGAMNAGMDNIFVNHTQAITELNPTFTVTHLNQLENIF